MKFEEVNLWKHFSLGHYMVSYLQVKTEAQLKK